MKEIILPAKFSLSDVSIPKEISEKSSFIWEDGVLKLTEELSQEDIERIDGLGGSTILPSLSERVRRLENAIFQE